MSEDQERSQQEEHWRELAQLLGIGPEPPAHKPAAKAPTPPPLQAKAPPPPPPEPEPVMPQAEAYEETVSAPVFEETVETPWEEPPLPDDAATEETEFRPDERDSEDRPRKGRRRKGRRGRREERVPAVTGERPADVNERDEDAAFPDVSDNGAEEIEDTTEPAEGPTEEDVEQENTLRDWNVPSWNELIASLYRPDR